MENEAASNWPVGALVALGFCVRDAHRLHECLPELDPHAMSTAVLLADTAREAGRLLHPVALVLWAHHNITLQQADELAHCGRGLVDLIAILKAVEESVYYRPSIAGMDVALDYATERTIPRHRLARYIELGFPASTAAAMERVDAPGSKAALDALSALRRIVRES